MGRYDEVVEAIAAGDLATVQARVLPEVLVSKGKPCLPLLALRAGRADAAAIVLAAFASNKKNRAPDGMTTPLGHLAHFARSALPDGMMSAEECAEVTRLGWDAGWRPAGDGHEELELALRSPELLDALLAVLPAHRGPEARAREPRAELGERRAPSASRAVPPRSPT